MYLSQNQREKSRERSRDRERKYYGKSPTDDDNNIDRKLHHRESRGRGKRVKFQGMDDIRVFRKEDQPIAKGLRQDEILKIKAEIQKELAKSYDFNWEHYKHRDAVSQSNSMKQQKQKEKALIEKLMSVKQLIVYICPLKLANVESLIQSGRDSLQREGHTARIHDILGCYYTHVSEIPNQPQFQILNTNTTSESKIIKFDNDLVYDDRSLGMQAKRPQENAKPLKGILKLPTGQRTERARSESRQIDPNLIYLLKDFKLNPGLYSKQRTQQLLRPYKESGELEYLMKNKEVLEALVRNTQLPNLSLPQKQTYPQSASMHRENREGNGRQPSPIASYSHTFVPKAEKFKTVPCKYYHSPQGCSKTDNCTFIHDDRYAGDPVLNNQIPPTSMPNPRVTPYPLNPMYGYMPPLGGMPTMPSNPNMYGPYSAPSMPTPNLVYRDSSNPYYGGGMIPEPHRGYQHPYNPNPLQNPQSGRIPSGPGDGSQYQAQNYGMESGPVSSQGYSNPNQQYYINNGMRK